MSNYSHKLNCIYCGYPLSQQEIDYIQHGTSVRCPRCAAVLTREQLQTASTDLIDTSTGSFATTPDYQSKKERGSGVLIFFFGLIILSLGLYSWVFYIPIFSEVYYGELFGIIVVVKGLSNLRKEATNSSGIWILAAGLFLWIMAWLSWITYIPVLSDGFIGEFGGLGLMIFGYLRSRQY